MQPASISASDSSESPENQTTNDHVDPAKQGKTLRSALKRPCEAELGRPADQHPASTTQQRVPRPLPSGVMAVSLSSHEEDGLDPPHPGPSSSSTASLPGSPPTAEYVGQRRLEGPLPQDSEPEPEPPLPLAWLRHQQAAGTGRCASQAKAARSASASTVRPPEARWHTSQLGAGIGSGGTPLPALAGSGTTMHDTLCPAWAEL